MLAEIDACRRIEGSIPLISLESWTKNMFYKGIAENPDSCEFRGRNFYMCICTPAFRII